VGKEYGKSAAYKRDPLHNLSHGATALQAARFYYLLETGQLVNPKLTAEMKRMLGNPGIHHKFVKGLEDHPEAKIFRKSGSWNKWHADSAIVEAEGRKYILVALAENPKGGSWLSNMIKPIHEFMVPRRLASNAQQ
jgi:beta-lactamase class A